MTVRSLYLENLVSRNLNNRQLPNPKALKPFTVYEIITSSTNWVCPDTVSSVEYLVVAGGGGGGGGGASGGGGAGGFRTGAGYPVIAGNTYSIVVGSGGAGGEADSGSGQA